MIWDQPTYPRWERGWALFPVDCDDGKTVWLQSFWMLKYGKYNLPTQYLSYKPKDA